MGVQINTLLGLIRKSGPAGNVVTHVMTPPLRAKSFLSFLKIDNVGELFFFLNTQGYL